MDAGFFDHPEHDAEAGTRPGQIKANPNCIIAKRRMGPEEGSMRLVAEIVGADFVAIDMAL